MIRTMTLDRWMICAFTAVILGILLTALPCLAEGTEVGDTAPGFSSLSTSGRFFGLSDIEGKPVLLSFWSDWCSSERQELEFLKKVSDRYPDVVIAIVNSHTGAPDIRSLTRIATSLAEFGIGAKILVDRGLEVTGLYKVTVLPTSILIDATGKITYRQANFFKSDIDQISATLDRAASVTLLGEIAAE